MIFVTVGTHEQQFNRLIKAIDNLAANSTIKENVIMQTGFCTYIPKHCSYKKMMSYQEMQKNIKNARIVITHGGPASFLSVVAIGKTPIVMPRLPKYNEHINNHQAIFCKKVEKYKNNIITVNNEMDLENTIKNYYKLASETNSQNDSNNHSFNLHLQTILKDICS